MSGFIAIFAVRPLMAQTLESIREVCHRMMIPSNGIGMRFLILDAGALGGNFGAKLLQSGVDVEFLVRPRRAAQLAENGLVVTVVPEGDIKMAVTTLQAGQIRHAYDVILLPCKAFDLSDAVASIAPAIGSNTSVGCGLRSFGTATSWAAVRLIVRGSP